MTPQEEVWLWTFAIMMIVTALVLIAICALFWIIEMLLKKPIEHSMKKMLKAGKITKEQFDDFERYIWWNYGKAL